MPNRTHQYGAIDEAFRGGNAALAERLCQEILAAHPDDHHAWFLRGFVAQREADYRLAAECFQAAIQLAPSMAKYHNNLGSALRALGRLAEAERCYERALEFRPDYPLAQINRTVTWLLAGDYGRGWPGYEWRWKQPDVQTRHFSEPRWDGSSFAGRTLLVHAEQGLGDTLQFVRFLPLVRLRGGSVILECPPELQRLLEGAGGADAFVPRGATLPSFDVQIPLLSLPGALGVTLDNLPRDTPYLRAEQEAIDRWRKALPGTSELLVGIAWQGNPRQHRDRWRSVPLAAFAPLAQLPGVRLVSLQKGHGSEQLAEFVDRWPLIDLGPDLDAVAPFIDTAAVASTVDLVISTDTAIAHLAGALGVPVWVPLDFAPDWRWLLEREDSPWYPTMRLFRQSQPRQWSDVFERLAAEAAKLVERKLARM